MRYLSEETMQRIIVFVDEYYNENSYSPTIAEITTELCIQQSMKALSEKEQSILHIRQCNIRLQRPPSFHIQLQTRCKNSSVFRSKKFGYN